jgi:hypothetical protein
MLGSSDDSSHGKERNMAIGVLMTMPETTQEQYERINEHIFGHYPMVRSDVPKGLILHSAGPVPEGWYVYDVWETKQDFQRFGRERIEPAVSAVTGRDFGEVAPQFYELANYYLPDEPEPARA